MNTEVLEALAASGTRIGAVESLEQWRRVLADEIAHHVPGAACTVYLAQDEDSRDPNTPDVVMLPLSGSDLGEGYVSIELPPAAPSHALSLARVLVQFAAARLNVLPAGVPVVDDSRLELSLLEQLQGLRLVLNTELDLQSLLNEVVRLAAEMTAAESATMILQEPQSQDLIVQAEWGHPDGPRPRSYVGLWGIATQVITEGQVVRIDHAPTDVRYTPPASGPPCKSLLSVPLRHGDKVVGALTVTSPASYFAFRSIHVALLTTLTHYATIGLGVSDLLKERQNQIHELSALYGISRRIQSAPDIEAALPSILEGLNDLIGAEGGEVYLTPSTNAATAPPRPTILAARWGHPIPADIPAWEVDVPLWRDGLDLGYIRLWRTYADGAFDDADVALAGAVADQLVLAVESRRLLMHDLEVLSDAPQHEPAPLHLHQLVARQLAQAHAIAGMPGGVALLYDVDTDDWDVVAELGDLPATWPLPRKQQRALLDVLRQTHEPVHHEFAAADQGVLKLVPLLTEDRLIGAFGLFSADHASLAPKLPFINALAGRAAVVIYNRQLQLHAEKLLILEERNLIAREMHDGLAQTMAQLRNRCELIARLLPTDPARALNELDTMRAVLKTNISEVIRVIHTLSPLTLEELGLPAALQKLTEEFTIRDRLQVELIVPVQVPILPPQIELTLFRVAQEALSNVTHEARANRCAVTLRADDHYVVLAVQDNARSDPHSDGAQPRRDLKMQKRIEEFRGQTTVSPAPDAGTLLTVTLPLPPSYFPQTG